MGSWAIMIAGAMTSATGGIPGVHCLQVKLYGATVQHSKKNCYKMNLLSFFFFCFWKKYLIKKRQQSQNGAKAAKSAFSFFFSCFWGIFFLHMKVIFFKDFWCWYRDGTFLRQKCSLFFSVFYNGVELSPCYQIGTFEHQREEMHWRATLVRLFFMLQYISFHHLLLFLCWWY